MWGIFFVTFRGVDILLAKLMNTTEPQKTKYSATCYNSIRIVGEVLSKNHDFIYDDRHESLDLLVTRFSGETDRVIVVIPKERIKELGIEKGSKISVLGAFCSYNEVVAEAKSKLILYVYSRSVRMENEESDMEAHNPRFYSNSLIMEGFLCKPPILRTTPKGRVITELLLASNRRDKKTDYIPCICWEKRAEDAANLTVGDKISIRGRVQSRDYNKRIGDTEEFEKRTAYEVSVNNFALIYKKED